MDKFVKDVVASVLGTPKVTPSAVTRPNYQRQKAQQRLVVTDVTPTPSYQTTPVTQGTHVSTEPTAAVRRASMAALIPSTAVDTPARASCSGTNCSGTNCSCSSSSTTLRKMVTPPRMLSEVLGIRYREGDSIVSLSTKCAEITSLIATDDLLIHQGVLPDAISYGALSDNAWQLSFSASPAQADALEPQLQSLWQNCSACGKTIVACGPSARLLHQLGINRPGAIAAVNGKTAADVVFALSEFLKTPRRANVYLVHHTAILQGDKEEISVGIEELNTIISRR